MVSYLVLRLRFESGFGSTIQETLAWGGASWSESGGSSCQTRRERAGQDSEWALLPSVKQLRDRQLQEQVSAALWGMFNERKLAPLDLCSEPWCRSWRAEREDMLSGPSPWVPLVGRRAQPGARPQHSSQTCAEDTGQRQWAGHTEGVSRKGESGAAHGESMRPRCETAQGT